ncbi:RHS repeat domain-containing protein [Cohnella nanjingensis]|uniref:RHS repeat domain-containing protein n=1 Tax=Cohnella nanjingensis TaxID=1387779 RepID=UPI00406BC4A2
MYNRLGQVIATYTNGKLQKQNGYNQLGWQLEETDAVGLKEQNRFTVNGLLESHTDRESQLHQYSYTPYNEVNRLSIKGANGVEKYWQQNNYDPTTRLLIGVTTSEGEPLAYHYDLWKRLDVQTAAGRNYLLGYDTADRLATLTYPDGKQVSYTYDNLSRIQTVNYPDMGGVGYSYSQGADLNKNVLTYSNGVVQERSYNAFGEIVSSLESKGNVPAWNESFGYDGFSNITAINRNGISLGFSYDKLNRIKQENAVTGPNTYSYDERGNRLSLEGSVTLPSTDSTEYTYNAINQLKTYSNSAGKQATYSYYGDGQRASKNVNGQLTRYVYLNGHIIEELDANGNVKARNIWGNELLFRKDYAANKGGYYSYNGHGDVVKITDAAGTAINTYDYDIWGNVLSSSEGMSNSFKYSGEVYDDESGLYYLRARYYDPSIGRFITEDTYEGQINNPLTLNLYTYVGNNPLIRWDPSGHNWVGDQWNGFVSGMKEVHSSWYTATDYWSLGLVSEVNDYIKVSQEKPMSLEQWGKAAALFVQVTPMKAATSGTKLGKGRKSIQ